MDMIAKYLPQASSYAADVDFLIWLVGVIVGVWFLLALGIFLGFIVKFAAKDGQKAMYIEGVDPKEKRWVSWPHYAVLAFDVVILVFAVKVWVNIKQDMPEADSTVRIIVQQWAWTFQHPGQDNTLDTPDDIFKIDELHLELDKTYHYELQSKDVLHDFSVPVFRLKQDAVPGRTIKGWFKPILPGGFDIQCAEMCGIGHGIMAARLYVQKPADFAAWVKANTPEGALAQAPAVPALNNGEVTP